MSDENYDLLRKALVGISKGSNPFYCNIILYNIIFIVSTSIIQMKPDDEILFCPICYKMIFKGRRPSSCNHFFCENCLYIWNKQSNHCPICRKYFSKIIIEDNVLPWAYSNK